VVVDRDVASRRRGVRLDLGDAPAVRGVHRVAGVGGKVDRLVDLEGRSPRTERTEPAVLQPQCERKLERRDEQPVRLPYRSDAHAISILITLP